MLENSSRWKKNDIIIGAAEEGLIAVSFVILGRDDVLKKDDDGIPNSVPIAVLPMGDEKKLIVVAEAIPDTWLYEAAERALSRIPPIPPEIEATFPEDLMVHLSGPLQENSTYLVVAAVTRKEGNG